LYFIILIKFNSYRFIAILIFNTTNNFIIRAFVEREEYFTQKKSNTYNLVIVDKNLLSTKNKKIDRETKLLLIAI